MRRKAGDSQLPGLDQPLPDRRMGLQATKTRPGTPFLILCLPSSEPPNRGIGTMDQVGSIWLSLVT